MSIGPYVWLVVGLCGFLLMLAPTLNRMRARRLEVFLTRVTDKSRRSIMVFTGVFVPVPEYFLVVDRGFEVKVNAAQYETLDVGDLVQVAEYSDGSYRLEHA